MPGTCTSTRLRPWRWMLGSVVPKASTRRRMVSIEAWMAEFMRWVSPASVALSDTPLSPLRLTSRVWAPVSPKVLLTGTDSLRKSS